MKILLTILSLVISSFCFAQKVKPQSKENDYKKVIIIEPKELSNFYEALTQWKRLTMFDPNTTSEEKVNTFRTIDAYINSLSAKVKMDSVRIDSVKTLLPKRK